MPKRKLKDACWLVHVIEMRRGEGGDWDIMGPIGYGKKQLVGGYSRTPRTSHRANELQSVRKLTGHYGWHSAHYAKAAIRKLLIFEKFDNANCSEVSRVYFRIRRILIDSIIADSAKEPLSYE